MSAYLRIQRQRLMQEAEGYLDLITSTSQLSPLRARYRRQLAERVIEVLNHLNLEESQQGRAAYLRGQAYRLMGKYHLALVALRKAVLREPGNVRIYLAMAWCHKRLGRLDLAIQALEEALEIDSHRGILHYNLACYWSLARNVGLTLAHLARAFELNAAYRRMVVRETDFDPVRQHPEFLALTSVAV